MSKQLDWAALLNHGGSVMPQVLREYVDRSDQIFLAQDKSISSAQFESLALDISWESFAHMRFSLQAISAAMQRELCFALQNSAPIEDCFRIFKKLMTLGLSSPVEKARLTIVLLNHLEGRISPLELRQLVEAVQEELRTCRNGCNENLDVLETFKKGPSKEPDDENP
jgi:hypothetical protein